MADLVPALEACLSGGKTRQQHLKTPDKGNMETAQKWLEQFQQSDLVFFHFFVVYFRVDSWWLSRMSFEMSRGAVAADSKLEFS
jgi:hypothetical protein